MCSVPCIGGGIALERSTAKSSDSVAYVIASLIILALLALYASRSLIVLHRIELPVIEFQAHLYARVLSRSDYEMEFYRIRAIRDALDAEFVKRGSYTAIRSDMLRQAVVVSSVRTGRCTRILACIFLGSFGSIITGVVMRARGRLYRTRDNVRRLEHRGVHGFIHLVGGHLDFDAIARIERCPTPENLRNAFTAVREKVNVPCSVVARLFPRGSGERLALLEYGKPKVKFADNPENAGRGPENERGT